MVNGIYYAHSGWRYIVILLAVLAIAKMLIGWLSNGRWGMLDRNLGMLFPISMDIQMLLGLILWILLQGWSGNLGMGSWEHPVTMIIALAVAHIGWSRAKQGATDRDKFQTAAIWFLIAGILVGIGVARITHVL